MNAIQNHGKEIEFHIFQATAGIGGTEINQTRMTLPHIFIDVWKLKKYSLCLERLEDRFLDFCKIQIWVWISRTPGGKAM